MIFLKQIINSIKSRGLLGTLKWGFDGYLKINNFIVFYRGLSMPNDSNFNSTDVVINEMTIEELTELRNKYNNLPFEFYCDQTQGFKHCYVACVNGHPAAIHWLVRSGEKSRFLDLEDSDVELNYNVVLPQYRGKKIAETLMAFIINDALKKNYKRIFGVVHVSNIPQYKPMLRLGFSPVECLTHVFLWRPKAKLIYVK